jgi:heme-degrading monooxygenase HmoA
MEEKIKQAFQEWKQADQPKEKEHEQKSTTVKRVVG